VVATISIVPSLRRALRTRVTRWGARRQIDPIEIVDGHVLIPHRANWREQPDWQRAWRTEIGGGLVGHEARIAPRVAPRIRLSWTISARDLQDRALLEARLIAARKSGKACAPYWGRSCVLAADVTSKTVTLEPTPWKWFVGDWIFLMDPTGEFDVREITGVAATTLTLSQAVSRTYAAGLQVWPVLFGRLIAEEIAAETSHRGHIRCSLQEIVASPSKGVVGIFATGTGIGFMRIGSTFVVAGDPLAWRPIRGSGKRPPLYPVVRQRQQTKFFDEDADRTAELLRARGHPDAIAI
jgi:hypothetical protein